MSISKNSVTARVSFTLQVDIPVSDSWGGECTVDQIQRQAIESAARVVTETVTKLREKCPAASVVSRGTEVYYVVKERP